MAVVCDKQSFMVVLGKETVIVVETDEISLEQLGESEFTLDDLPGIVEITESTAELVIASCEDMGSSWGW